MTPQQREFALRLADSAHLGYRVGWQREATTLLRALAAEREAIIDINASHGGSVEVEAAIRARGEK